MMTVAIAAAKGGVGKTTLAAALAVAVLIEDPGRRVALIDLDPQGSLTAWWNERKADTPLLYQRGRRPLKVVNIEARLNAVKLLILDCPPGFSSVLEEAIGLSDLVLIPTSAGALDLLAVASTVDMAQRLGRPYRLVLNRAVFRSRLAGKAVRTLRDSGALLEPPVHQRVAIAEAMASGGAVVETEPGSRAAQEVMALWRAVDAVMSRPRKRRPTGTVWVGAKP